MSEKRKNSRTKNSLRNLIVNIVSQSFVVIINFIARTIFIKTLGEEILGINGLFSNIINILSLAELGFSNAIIYGMYKPLKDGDNTKIKQLLKFYRKIYRLVSLTILILGLCVIPFLGNIINTEAELGNVSLFYVLYLLNTVASYTIVYKTSLIIADQKTYILKLCSLGTLFLQFFLQTLILFATKNFALYLLVQIFCTLLNNLIGTILTNKKYPYVKEDDAKRLSKQEQKIIFKNVGAMFIHKISGIILNNTDNILISILIGTIWVGRYSNYFMLTSAFANIIYIVLSSATASVGDLMIEDDKRKQLSVFNKIMFLCFILVGFITVELATLYNDFITIWIGKDFILDDSVVAIIILNFYIVGILTPTWIFRDASGLFGDTKTSSAIMAIMNIVLSLIFGKIFGLFGILLATAVSRLCISFWYQPMLLYRLKFLSPFRQFIFRQIQYVICIVSSVISSVFICNMLFGDTTSVFTFILKGLTALIVFSTIVLICLRKHKEFKESKELLSLFKNKITH
ncbi:lipopolysaccharide biosynthesis protein [Candidatus Saccharibacteria bacterium]|nr:lipopolysaccharide biosynthesis protein [Candidatus Saccharibacteria bacterium]